jgi:hypothetical protein
MATMTFLVIIVANLFLLSQISCLILSRNSRFNNGVQMHAMKGVVVNQDSPNEYTVTLSGAGNGIGAFGALIYGKIYKDQEEEQKKLPPARGMRPGKLPLYIIQRIHYATVREMVKV